MNELAKYNGELKGLEKEKKSLEYESKFWEALFSIPTPEEMVYEREGPKGEMLEYIKRDYTQDMLNKLFPGWYEEGMKLEFYPQIATYVVTGYLCVAYLTPEGRKTRKVWAVGAAQVIPKKNPDPDKGILPLNPDDPAKAAYTDWIKQAGRMLGIGADVYSQKIPQSYYEEYESIVKHYGYRHITDAVVAQIDSKRQLRKYIDNLPTPEQANKFAELASHYPDKEKLLWEQFQKHSKISVENLINQLELKIKEKEEKNGNNQ